MSAPVEALQITAFMTCFWNSETCLIPVIKIEHLCAYICSSLSWKLSQSFHTKGQNQVPVCLPMPSGNRCQIQRQGFSAKIAGIRTHIHTEESMHTGYRLRLILSSFSFITDFHKHLSLSHEPCTAECVSLDKAHQTELVPIWKVHFRNKIVHPSSE